MAATAYDTPVKPEHFCELPRYKELQQLRKYLKGTQYDGRPDFFTGLKPGDHGEPVPLRERKPCVIYPMPRGCVEQVVKFTFGEQRFPKIGVEKVEADDAIAGLTLTEEEAEFLEGLVAGVIENAQLRPGIRRTMRQGLGIGATCAILSLKRGRFRLQLANAEDVYPVFTDGDPAGELERLTWAYTFNKSVTGEDGKPVTKRFWYRLDVDRVAFTEFTQIEVKPGEAPIWTPLSVKKHDLGFVPAHWVRNASGEGETGIDGFSIYGEFLDEFDALNFALSQRHRGLNTLGVPQPWETGVDEDDGPQASGRVARGYSPSDAESPHGRASQLRPARMMGGSTMWTYRGDKAKVGLLETTGKAFEVATSHVNDVRSRILESMGVVLVSVSEVMGKTQAGQMSAKFLEMAYEPLLALVDEMRCSWWDGALKPIVELMLRWIAKQGGQGILIAGAEKAAPLLKKFTVDTTDGPVWFAPKMVPNWGPYFSAGPEEIGKMVDAASKARDARLVPEKDAAKYVLPAFGRDDTAEAIDEIEEDRDAAAERAKNDAAAQTEALHAVTKSANGDGEKQGGARGASGEKPPAAAGE
jgi:hypothetical protein